MSEHIQTLRTVADFASVPPGQLPHCLRAFKGWLHQKQQAETAHEEFVWTPASVPREPTVPDRSTAIGELGLRPGAVRQFGLMGVRVLEDFARLSPLEVARVVHVGPRTVVRIAQLLAGAGLELRTSGSSDASDVLRAAPQPASEAVGDGDELASLGLKRQTVRKLAGIGVRSVGALRALTPAVLASALSLQRRHEVFRTLRVHGLTLLCNPDELELWRAGLLHVSELRAPDDDASVLELQPWIGSLARAVDRGGVRTVGELRRLARVGVVQRGERLIAPSSWARIRRHFGISPHETLWPEPEPEPESEPALRATTAA
jgi:hypothetical protein